MLDEAEFLGFLHPEAELHMVDILVTETLADLDKVDDLYCFEVDGWSSIVYCKNLNWFFVAPSPAEVRNIF